MGRVVFILATLAALQGNVRADERARGLAAGLMDEEVSLRDKYALFGQIEKMDDHGFEVVKQLRVLMWKSDEQGVERGWWAIWCIVGPELYHRLRSGDGNLNIVREDLQRTGGLKGYVIWILERCEHHDKEVRALANLRAREVFGDKMSVEIADALIDAASGVGARAIPARRQLIALERHAKSLAARRIIERNASGEVLPLELLKLADAEESDAARLARWVAQVDPRHRKAFQPLMKQVSDGQPAAVEWQALLVEGGPVALEAAKIAAASPRLATPNGLVVALVQAGNAPAPEVVQALKPDRTKLMPWLTMTLDGGNPSQKWAALAVLQAIGMEGEEVRRKILSLVLGPDPNHHDAAVKLLSREDLAAVNDLWVIVSSLSSREPRLRQIAARQLHEAKLVPAEIGDALVKAVDGRDFAVREGLIIGIVRGLRYQRDVIGELNDAANQEQDAARRAYAKAALRALGRGGK